MKIRQIGIVLAGTLLCVGAAQAKKFTPNEACAVQKAKIASEYYSCIYKRDFARRNSNNASNAHGACETKFTRFWTKIESRNADVNGNTLCPLFAGEESLSSAQRAQNVIDALQQTYASYFANFEGTGPVPGQFVPPPPPPEPEPTPTP